MRREFQKTTGNVWHHLVEYVDNNEVLDRHGTWVKTSIIAWQRAFSKCSLNNRYGEKSEGWDTSVASINEAKGLCGYFSKDHYEVFFDEKI